MIYVFDICLLPYLMLDVIFKQKPLAYCSEVPGESRSIFKIHRCTKHVTTRHHHKQTLNLTSLVNATLPVDGRKPVMMRARWRHLAFGVLLQHFRLLGILLDFASSTFNYVGLYRKWYSWDHSGFPPCSKQTLVFRVTVCHSHSPTQPTAHRVSVCQTALDIWTSLSFTASCLKSLVV